MFWCGFVTCKFHLHISGLPHWYRVIVLFAFNTGGVSMLVSWLIYTIQQITMCYELTKGTIRRHTSAAGNIKDELRFISINMLTVGICGVTFGVWRLILFHCLWSKSLENMAKRITLTPILTKQINIVYISLQWRQNEGDGVSNNQPRDCYLNRLFWRRRKKSSKLHVTTLCEGNSPVIGEFPAHWAHFITVTSKWGRWRLK